MEKGCCLQVCRQQPYSHVVGLADLLPIELDTRE
jgi:hypothetical protein